MLTEFGGIACAARDDGDTGAWGYTVVDDAEGPRGEVRSPGAHRHPHADVQRLLLHAVHRHVPGGQWSADRKSTAEDSHSRSARASSQKAACISAAASERPGRSPDAASGRPAALLRQRVVGTIRPGTGPTASIGKRTSRQADIGAHQPDELAYRPAAGSSEQVRDVFARQDRCGRAVGSDPANLDAVGNPDAIASHGLSFRAGGVLPPALRGSRRRSPRCAAAWRAPASGCAGSARRRSGWPRCGRLRARGSARS